MPSLRIDSHAHVFPPLTGASGFASPAEHLQAIQRHCYSNVNPALRRRDGAIVDGQQLWNGRDRGPAGLTSVGLRVGEFGRIEWRHDGEEVYVQLFAPSLPGAEASVAYLLAEMDYAGVDLAVIQQGFTYGRLNGYIADAVARHRDRLIGLAQVREAYADLPEQRGELERCAALGLRGLFYSTLGFWETSYRDGPAARRFKSFWEEVARSELVVFWDINIDEFGAERYADELEALVAVLLAHPDLRVVLVQAFPLELHERAGGYELPSAILELARHERTLFELALPISRGLRWRYPYLEATPMLQTLRDRLGADRIVWGSDMPAVVRFCTYRQSHDYLATAEVFAEDELELIMGTNLATMLGARPTQRPAQQLASRKRSEP